MRYSTIDYNTKDYPFIEIVERLYNTTNLENLHTLTTEKYDKLFEVGADSSTVFHTIFYDKYREGWEELEILYGKFVKDIISPLIPENFLYQTFPTFRVHLPNNIAVGKFHKDAEFGHPEGEINYIIALTNSSDTASVWVEEEEDKGNFEAMVLEPGKLVTFNGNRLTHGNKVNRTGKTRVSMDFRVLPISKYNKDKISESITTKTKFTEGKYYKLYENSL